MTSGIINNIHVNFCVLRKGNIVVTLSVRPSRSKLNVKGKKVGYFPFLGSNFNVYGWIFLQLNVNYLLEMAMYFAKHSAM